jgi:excisionase family DNA binding protein
MAALLTLNRLAAELRLPRDWLRREAKAGRLPCLRVGRRLVFNLAAVEQALADRAASPAGEKPPE